MPPPIETPNWKILQLYTRYWRPYPLLTIGCLLFSLGLALKATIMPLLVAMALNQLITHHTIDVGLLVFAGGFQFVLVGINHYLDGFAVSTLHKQVVENLYEDCFKYLAYQDYAFFADNFSGSIVTMASRFAKVYTTFSDTVFFDLIPQLTVVVISIGIMSYYSPVIGIITFLFWLFSSVLVVKFALARLPLRRTAIAKESEQVGELADTITNTLTVKTFAAEDREITRYQKINHDRAGMFLRSWRRAVRNGFIIELLCVVLQMIVFVGGIIAVHKNTFGVATFLLFQVYIFRIIENLRSSTFVVRQLEVVAGDGQEMAELFEQAPLVQDKPFAEKSQITRGAVTITDMEFQYSDAGTSKALFNDFSLQIKPGEKVGLVGPSGGGKTTITRLLLRFMDIQSGSIKIDGQDIRDIKQQDLRRAIAYVPQEPLLFHRSIKENIRYGKPSASEDEVIAVAKKAFAHDFIAELPDGYDTLVGERGVKLSGGQRQRVAIARAMLADAPLLILDEATSALDSESERLIQRALRELMKRKTAVVIAHRLSTIQRLDRIIVIARGKVVEEGSHEELLQQKGLYARLWAHQSGGFIES
ncbi:MAG TPA: ABC transporter ATP-binding protein [Candidatus Saccharimonadales bacterium]